MRINFETTWDTSVCQSTHLQHVIRGENTIPSISRLQRKLLVIYIYNKCTLKDIRSSSMHCFWLWHCTCHFRGLKSSTAKECKWWNLYSLLLWNAACFVPLSSIKYGCWFFESRLKRDELLVCAGILHSYSNNRVYCAHIKLYILTPCLFLPVHYKYLAVLQGVKYLTQQ